MTGAEKSPDYGKSYTIYCYYELTTTKTVFYTPIYKVTFTNYTNNPFMPDRVFGRHLKEKAMESIKKQFPDTFLGYPNNFPKMCLNYKELKDNYDSVIASWSDLSKNAVIVNDVQPGKVNCPSASSNTGQTVTFEFVK